MSFHNYCLKGSKIPSDNTNPNPSTEIKSEKENRQDEWTTWRLIDELYLYLMKYDIRINEADGIKKSKYEKQTEELMYRIPVYEPIPSFIVNVNDLNDKLKEELKILDTNSLADVMNEAVGRLFENVNERYFRLSVKRLLKCELK